MNDTVQARYEKWRAQSLRDDDLTRELLSVEGQPQEIYERFYTDLSFGTAGLRGVLGAGTNRMNIYTVGRATQGLANYIRRNKPDGSVAIACDSRIKSQLFAETAAGVLAANGLHVRLYPELAPTPMLSWAVRHHGCDAGIVVTASHNPAEYNGYKVYGSDGCQLTTEASDALLAQIERLDLFADVRTMDFDRAVAAGWVQLIGRETTDAYFARVAACQVCPDVLRQSDLCVAFTPLNGAGGKPVRRVLSDAGLTHLHVVPEQEMPDGLFPTCKYPNPEAAEAMELGLALAKRVGADLLIGTDPDVDRVGVASRDGDGYTLLTGNEVGVLLIDYLGRVRSAQGTLPERPLMIKSIVSTTLADIVAQHYGIEMRNVLTGFKYIGELIGELEANGEDGRFVFAFEESCGYLPGPYVRDKDAVATSLMVAEMAAWHKAQGRTLADALRAIYAQFGAYYNHVVNTAFKGADGMATMMAIMDALFALPPDSVAGQRVAELRDYRASVAIRDGERVPLGLPRSDVISLSLEDGATVVIRPSGTEPKLKVYYMVRGDDMQRAKDAADVLIQAVTELIDRAAATDLTR